MTIRVGLTHRTTYHYDRPVKLSPQIIRLRPAAHARTPVQSYALKIGPEPHFLNWLQDPQGNHLARIVFPDLVTHFSFEVDLVADMAVFNPFDFFLEPDAEQIPFVYPPVLSQELAPFLMAEPAGPRLAAFLAQIDRTPLRTVDFLVNLNQTLLRAVDYVIRLEPGVQSCEETLTKRTGSCRDSAWLMVQILRHLGLAARFVSGYLIQLVPDQKPLDGPSGPSSDFTDLHAWAEVYVPGAGWIGLDATSGLFAGEGHIPLACTPDPASAAPVSGAVDDCVVTFDYHMEVQRIYETPRVTKPYRSEQWEAIDALGQQVDAMLVAGDVRLTMGGEPTFVSIDDPQGEEWNTAAVGPTKQAFAYDLILKLRERFAPGGLLTFGQGKWYPGEPLPRWAFSLYWRGDGMALWQEESLIAPVTANQPPDDATVLRFGEELSERLGISSDHLLPAYEDPIYYAAQEQLLPVNLDPLEHDLTDAEERARLVRVLKHGLHRPVGYVLPIQRWNAKATGPRWVSSKWPFRQDRLFLLPGDSPLGFRLPLEALPVLPPNEYPYIYSQDPFASRGPLPPMRGRKPQSYRAAVARESTPPASGYREQHLPTAETKQRDETKTAAEDLEVRTALCLQPRDGRLCVFMPPLENADDFVALVSTIEDVARDLSVPLHIEGYSPPLDSRLNVIKVTPDPGVIEVNVHPAHNWPQLRDGTIALYESARQARLGTEKFMVDGRHVGTGGGNHIVVGGATAADSPFLRRPDVLGSLVRCWQNFPSLSYLFSGLFIGPTSQAPRVDEARDDSLYELEIALAQLPDPGADSPPWVVDRILRNVLIDVTGNTHRTEICIDKLFSPDGPTGRLGLVEFRAFEMPPHAQMSCAQQLLLRGLIAHFWNHPYRAPLIHWGNALRDRFMLPEFVWQNFRSLLSELRAAGLPFEDSWFAPHFEFRFPRHGSVRYDGVGLELRHALEPWHVLGEEPGAGGTVRYVDSSVERLQVKLDGASGDRLIVTCNGRRVPMTQTGVEGERVGGVRYRAWAPASALHPTIGLHSPLIFDVLDSWNGRSLGGCTYHVVHPGGRNYETFPVNSNEAESRRLARFFPFGHHIGRMSIPPEECNPSFPATLDLRWPGPRLR